MPINKNAYVRYMALDRCLSSKCRRYYMDDLVKACCRELANVNGDEGPKGAEGVSRRQVYKDLNDMESTFGVFIARVPDGYNKNKKYYTYEKGSKTLRMSQQHQDEIDLMSDALMTLKRLDGVPQLEWLDSLEKTLHLDCQMKGDSNKVVSFQHNPYLAGMDEWYKPLFDAVMAKRMVELVYRTCGNEERVVRMSPYLLKQYNNCWFLIGKSRGASSFTHLPIGCIESVKEVSQPFESLPKDFDFDDYFCDVVGVTVIQDAPVHDVVLRVTEQVLPCIKHNPLHGSQRVKNVALEDGRYEVHLRVQDNVELRALLKSFGAEIEVVAPESLREEMCESVRKLAGMYFLSHCA